MPIFDSTKSVKKVHLVWVELVGLPCWQWDSLKDLASKLGSPLFIPTLRGLGCQSNRVCVGWDMKVPPPKQMIINVGASIKVIPLNFGAFFWDFLQM